MMSDNPQESGTSNPGYTAFVIREVPEPSPENEREPLHPLAPEKARKAMLPTPPID